jgi:hypothetical protein
MTQPILIAVPRSYRFSEWADIIPKSGHWFSKNAMAFFGSRILWGTLRPIAGDNFTFITSEERDGVRKYTVREWYPDGVHTIGEFWSHATRADAIKAQNKAHREEEAYVNSFN